MALVCMGLKLTVGMYGSSEKAAHFNRTWKLGSCHGELNDFDYFDRCCLTSGQYTLICTNHKSKFGWGNASIEIQGQTYCDDFIGYKGMRTVYVSKGIHFMYFYQMTMYNL